jgi:hypothetical protein
MDVSIRAVCLNLFNEDIGTSDCITSCPDGINACGLASSSSSLSGEKTLEYASSLGVCLPASIHEGWGIQDSDGPPVSLYQNGPLGDSGDCTGLLDTSTDYQIIIGQGYTSGQLRRSVSIYAVYVCGYYGAPVALFHYFVSTVDVDTPLSTSIHTNEYNGSETATVDDPIVGTGGTITVTPCVI